MKRRTLLTALSASPLITANVWAQNVPTSFDEVWFDVARARNIPVRIHLPVGQNRCGLILYSHGLGGSLDGAQVWTKAWQAAGFAVIQMQHAGSDRVAVMGGLPALKLAFRPEQLVARVYDAKFVLDELARLSSKTPWIRIDLGRVGMAGHSYGAITTLALAGQVPWNLGESRFGSFLALSPSFRAQNIATAFLGMKVPMLIATGTLDLDPFPNLPNAVTPSNRASIYPHLPSGKRAQIVLSQADHYTFGGNAELIRPQGIIKREAVSMQMEPAHHEVLAKLSADWWLATLQSDSTANGRLLAPQGITQQDHWAFDRTIPTPVK